MQLGIVSGRVALLLRSTEIQPVLLRFVSGLRANPLPPLRETRPGRVGLSFPLFHSWCDGERSARFGLQFGLIMISQSASLSPVSSLPLPVRLWRGS
jgi:hypothetical protein